MINVCECYAYPSGKAFDKMSFQKSLNDPFCHGNAAALTLDYCLTERLVVPAQEYFGKIKALVAGLS